MESRGRLLVFLILAATCHQGQSMHHNLMSPFQPGTQYLYKLLLEAKAEPQTLRVEGESGFRCEAFLYIQPRVAGEGKILDCQMDVKYLSLFNGPGNSVHDEADEYRIDLKDARYKNRIHELEKIFSIHLDERQLLKHIRTSPDEELWSVNIKKAIASNLQFPVQRGNRRDFAVELTVGGECESWYTTIPFEHNLFVYRMRDSDKCQNAPFIAENSKDFNQCACIGEDDCRFKNKNPQRSVFTLTEDGTVLQEAEFKGSSIFALFSPEGFILEVNDKMHLLLLNTGAHTRELADARVSWEHKPVFVFENPAESLDSPLSFSDDVAPQTSRLKRFKFDQERLQNEVHKKITTLSRSIRDKVQSEEFFLGLLKPLLGARRLLGSLNLQSLRKLYDSFEKDENPRSRQILIRSLSLAGSSHSIYFLYTLGKEKKLSELEASSCFTWSLSLTGLSHDLLKSIWEVLEQYDKSTSTYEHALIGFGTLVFHACKPAPNYGIGSKSGRDASCDWEQLKVIANRIREQAINGKTYPLQLASLLTITNMGNDFTKEVSQEIAFNSSKNSYLRAHALFSLHKEQHSMSPEMGNRLIDIVSDRRENHDLRLKSLTMLFAHGSYDTMFLTLKVAKKYFERHLVHYCYSLLHAMSHLDDTCVANKAETAKRLLNSMGNPHLGAHQSHSWAHYFKYKDNEYGFNGGLFFTVNRSPKSYLPSYVYAMLNWKVQKGELYPVQFQMNLHGVESVYPYGYHPKETTDFEGEEDIQERNHGDFHFEVVVKYHNQVAFLKTYTVEQIAVVMTKKDGLAQFIQSLTGNIILGDIYYSKYSFVNDLGLPVELQGSMPFLKVSDLEFSGTPQDSLSISYAFRGLLLSSLSFSFYNPIMDTLHSVSRITTTTLSIPFESTISLDHQKKSEVPFRIVVYPSKDITTYFGINSSIVTSLFDLNEEKIFDFGQTEHYDRSRVPINHVVDVNAELDSTCSFETEIFYPLKHVASVPCSYARGSYDELRGHVWRKFYVENLPHNDYNLFYTLLAMQRHLTNYATLQPHKGNLYLATKKTHIIREIAFEIVSMSHIKDPGLQRRTDSYSFRFTVKYLNGSTSSHDASIEYQQLSLVRHNLNAKFSSKTVHGRHETCLEGKIDFPEFTGLDVWSREWKKTSEYLITWGRQCSQRQGSLSLKMEADYSPKQGRGLHFHLREVTENHTLPLEQMLRIYNENPEGIEDIRLLRKLCSHDTVTSLKGTSVASSYACTHLAYYASQITNSKVHIQHENLPFGLKKAYHNFLSILRFIFKPYHDIEESGSVREESGVGHVAVERRISVTNKTVSYRFSNSLFDDVFTSIPSKQLPFVFRPSYKLWNTKFLFEKLGMLRTCQVTAQYVRLIQGYAVANNLSHCSTVISRECSDAATFTVLARRTTIDGRALEVTVYLRKNKIDSDLVKIEITPSDDESSLQLTIDGKDVFMTENVPFCYEEEDHSCLFRIWEFSGLYFIKSIWHHGVFVIFDGEFLNVGVDARHTGTHCGLCGDYSGGFSETISPPGHEWEYLYASTKKQLKSARTVNEQWILKYPC